MRSPRAPRSVLARIPSGNLLVHHWEDSKHTSNTSFVYIYIIKYNIYSIYIIYVYAVYIYIYQVSCRRAFLCIYNMDGTVAGTCSVSRTCPQLAALKKPVCRFSLRCPQKARSGPQWLWVKPRSLKPGSVDLPGSLFCSS